MNIESKFKGGSMLNKNWQRRNEILGIPADNKSDFISIKNVSYDALVTLYKENFINAEEDDEWNECAGNNAFYEFMSKFPYVKCHGYIIGIDRDDYRVTIEGISYDTDKGEIISEDLRENFVIYFRMADEFKCTKTKLYCWYD